MGRMSKVPLRMRLVGATLGRVSLTALSPARIVAQQQRVIPHMFLTDALFGGLAKGASWHDESVPVEAGHIPVRVYRPDGLSGTLPLVVFFHGGGWITGSLNQYDWLTSHIAVRAGAVVVSVGYRLAPTYRWPVATEDCFAALLAAVARADQWQGDPHRVAVAGDSAGGNLAAVVALMSRDRGGPQIAFQALIYPVTDLTMASPSIDENAHAPILTKEKMISFGGYYTDAEHHTHPYASPLLAPSHTGLAPALIQVAEFDPLRDDGLRYAAALKAAGVPVRTTQYVGATHGFYAFPTIDRVAPQALEELTTSLAEGLGPTATA
jgi:acetyl esterase